MDISARFADQEEVLKLEGKGFTSVSSDTGRLVMPAQGIRASETIKLGIAKFLWNIRITVKGLRYDG